MTVFQAPTSPCNDYYRGVPLLEADEKAILLPAYGLTLLTAPPTDNEFAISRLDAAVDRVLGYLWQYFMVTVDAYQSVTTHDSQLFSLRYARVRTCNYRTGWRAEPELPPEYIPRPDDML